MAFTDIIRTIPFTGRTPTGEGFFPPIFRASGHVLYLVGNLADETTEVTVEQALQELQHAQEHWEHRTTTANISTDANERAITINQLLTAARTEYENWDDATRLTNIRDLAHRIAEFSAFLDRELVGLRNSDPGTAL